MFFLSLHLHLLFFRVISTFFFSLFRASSRSFFSLLFFTFSFFFSSLFVFVFFALRAPFPPFASP
jgi:hypothetical protein